MFATIVALIERAAIRDQIKLHIPLILLKAAFLNIVIKLFVKNIYYRDIKKFTV